MESIVLKTAGNTRVIHMENITKLAVIHNQNTLLITTDETIAVQDPKYLEWFNDVQRRLNGQVKIECPKSHWLKQNLYKIKLLFKRQRTSLWVLSRQPFQLQPRDSSLHLKKSLKNGKFQGSRLELQESLGMIENRNESLGNPTLKRMGILYSCSVLF